MSQPTAALLSDGRRLHLQHGPCDLIVEAFGNPTEVQAAYAQARKRFGTVLDELVAELPQLRKATAFEFDGVIARRMAGAVMSHRDCFVTPMASVAGAIADEVLDAMIAGRTLERAYVNNGGDIALHLVGGACFDIGLAATTNPPTLAGKVSVVYSERVRGVATSGRHGRSLSLGIADAVTVLAQTAASADTAATLIANAVDLPAHPSISRLPAWEIDPDSDLGDRLVTVDVGNLSGEETATALKAGCSVANTMVQNDQIIAAALCLNGDVCLLGNMPSLASHEEERKQLYA